MSGLLIKWSANLWLGMARDSGKVLTESHRTLFTSPVSLYATRKRRKRHPFFWLQDQYKTYYDEKLTPENEKFFQEFLKDKYEIKNGSSPLKSEPWPEGEKFDANTRRTGVIAMKLGPMPFWAKDGTRVYTQCLRVCDNHVIRYHSPEEYAKIGRPVDVKRRAGKGCIIVGADSTDPRKFTAEYNGLFEESGVMPKKKLTRFFISHNARIEPGTPLMASHFRPGMHVDVSGKTVEHGLQGVRVRHQMKCGRDTHGATKNHNRLGSIGRGRRWCGPLKGKRMPGWEGGERKSVCGLKLWAIDTKYNLLYVQGSNIPGPPGSYVNVMDTNSYKTRLTEDNPPPFPTASLAEHRSLDEVIYDETLHKPTDPSLVFEVTEAEKRALEQAAKRMFLGKTAQKIR